MLSHCRFWVTLLSSVVLGVIVAVGTAVSSGAEVSSVTGGWASTHALSSRLVIPGVQLLDGGQQESDELLTDRTSPVAVAARWRSRTQYEGLGPAAVARLVAQTEPGLVARSSSGLGRLPLGARVARYLGSRSARVVFAGGQRAVVQSLTPMAVASRDGLAPVDLRVRRAVGGFAAVRPAVPVRIPLSLADGIGVGSIGLSLTPVGPSGMALRGSGRVDGGAVLYPNTEADADTAVKPISMGLETYTTLRSVDSPQRLLYRVGVPRGATIVADRLGNVSVLAAGRVIAVIPAATAVDGAGTPVPVVTRLSDRTIELSVAHHHGDYRYPIVVDPTMIDPHIEPRSSTDWRFESEPECLKGSMCAYDEPPGFWELVARWYRASEWGALLYPTQGESRIYEMSMETASALDSGLESHLVIFGRGGWEGSTGLAAVHSRSGATVCASVGCSSSGGSPGNIAAYWMNAVAEGTNGNSKTTNVYAASVYVAQNNGPTISFDTTKEKVASGTKNVLSPSGGWISPSGGAVEVDYSDPGVGVNELVYTAGAVKWTEPAGWPWNMCSGLQCAETGSQQVSYSNQGVDLPDGESTLEAKAINGMGSSYTVGAKVKVDGTAPHEIGLSGLPAVMTDSTRNLKLTAHATDGVTGTPSSGVGFLKLLVDGREIGAANGSCSPGPCTATGEWTLNGESFATGKHEVVVTATDAAGNVATVEAGTFSVHHADLVSLGAGQFNPITGDFDLDEKDVSIAAPGSPLTLTRDYSSREPSAGGTEAFGAPWTLSFGGAQKLVKGYQGNMTLVATDGSQTMFISRGVGSFESPPGDRALTLTGSKSETEFMLSDNGSTTTFTHIAGDTENVYRASLGTGAGGTHTIQYTYQSVGGVLEPLQELAPIPAGVSCSPALKPGCRALTYNFATATTATGESSSQWGDYTGRLTRVYFSTGELAGGELVRRSIEVAHYLYDSKGRLRATWDPRISPSLKTTYGYDSEGHVTAVTPPGKETWSFTYGTTSKDTSPGRLLKVYRPPASESLWTGEAPKTVTPPKLTGVPALGGIISTSDGTWSGGPITYGYQWERCNSSGGECVQIGGATNAMYAPVTADLGHTLMAQVTAENGGGAVTASTAVSAVVVAGSSSYAQSIDNGNSLNAVSCVPGTTDCVVTDSKGNVLYSSNVKVGSGATWTSWSGPGVSPSEGISCPTTSLCVLLDGEKSSGGESVYYASAFGGAWTNAQNLPAGATSLSCPSASWCLAGQHNGMVDYSSIPGSMSWTRKTLTTTSINAPSCLSGSFCVIGDGAGNVLVATSKTQVESSSWTTSNVDGTTTINGISCVSTTSCVAVDSMGNVLDLTIGAGGEASAVRHDIDVSGGLTAVSCASSTCVAVDGGGYAFVSHDAGESWTVAYRAVSGLTSVSCASTALCATVDAFGEEISLNPDESGVELRRPQPGSAIEYGVPISGTGAPYQMGSGEVAKWAQTDVPVEATAVFATDELQGWPANDYRRATVDYLDANDRLVNVATPGGGIVTSEYNSYNDVVRNLTADNRAAALNEGAKSAEVSQALDTQSTYGEEGSELLSVLGPLHVIRLANGGMMEARKHTVYSYDEDAPSTGGPYRLVTKVTEGAQIFGEPEADTRTTKISYAGQNNLGWVLRKPTATWVDPSGLKLVYSTVYDPATGNVVETRTPGAGAPNEETFTGYVYRSGFGGSGSGSGQLSKPAAIATDAEGNIWVADTANNRVEEFSSGGAFVRQFGTVGEGNGQLKSPRGVVVDREGRVWVADTGNNRVQVFSNTGTYLSKFGKAGSLESKEGGVYFKSPTGIAYASEKNMIYVTDTGNNRLQLFRAEESSFEGSNYIYSYGYSGSGNGQFNKPEGITVHYGWPTQVWIADTGNNRIQEFTQYEGFNLQYNTQFGTLGSGNGQLSKPEGVAVDSKDSVLVADGGNNRIESFSSTGVYQYQFGSLGTNEKQMKAPAGLTLDTSDDAYVLDTGNNRIEKWQPSLTYHEGSGTGGTYGKQTIYYTAAENTEVPACGKHAEWAGLACEARPAAQPETSGLPSLPVTTVTYNEWDEPYSATETVGSSTRTVYNHWEGGVRLWGEEVKSSVGTGLPLQEFRYNSETGELKSQAPLTESTRSIEWTHNRLGELTSYKDADGSTTTYSYDAYGRLESVNDGKGTQTYGYDTTTGLPNKLADSAAGTFTASYDAEGNLETVSYPNGMDADHTYDATGSEVGIAYSKMTHCSSGCLWYIQNEIPSIHGQALYLTSSLSSQTYTYDAAGRLTKAQDTPAGEGCTTRVYAYDQETNITSLTTRPPGGGGVCATEGGTAVNHTYDPANRLVDAGIAYGAFGDITKLPAGDAGGTELVSSYYVDNSLASQTQGGQTLGYYEDPEGRYRQIVSTGTVNSTVTYHYAADGREPSWTEDTAGKWTRNIYGLDGELVATQNGGESPVLQVEDLKADVVGTASLSETATGLLSKGDQTEYGVPRTSSPPKYSWNGAYALRTELPSGVIAMGARSYVPRIGRFLQPDPIEGGSANAYAYTYGDPVDSADPSGEYTVATPSWVVGFLDEQAEIQTEAAIQRAAEEQAAREEAEEKAREVAEEAAGEAAVAATEAYTGGGKKSKKGKVRVGVAMYHDGGGQNSKPKYKTQKKIPPNKKCEDGEVKVGEYCEKGPGKKERPDPPIPPPTVIEEIGKDAEGAVDDCIESGLCEL